MELVVRLGRLVEESWRRLLGLRYLMLYGNGRVEMSSDWVLEFDFCGGSVF